MPKLHGYIYFWEDGEHNQNMYMLNTVLLYVSLNVTCCHLWHGRTRETVLHKNAKTTNTIRGLRQTQQKGQIWHTMASAGSWQLHKHTHTNKSPALLIHDQQDTCNTVAPNCEQHTEKPFGVISNDRCASPTPLLPQKLPCSSGFINVFPSSPHLSFPPSIHPSIPPSPLQGHSSHKENRPSSGFSIELSVAGCFNNSCKIKWQGTFVKWPHLECSTGVLRWTLHCKMCPCCPVFSCL